MRTAGTAEEMRDRILDAAERLLARFGYRKMTLDDLAREAGIGRRTLYLYFPGKEEITLCSIDRVVARIHEQLRAIASGPGPAEERLRRMLVTRVLARFDQVHDYHQSLDDMFAVLRPAYLTRRERYFDAEAHIFAEVLQEGQCLGAFAPLDPVQTAHTLLWATNSLLPYSLSVQELGAREDVEARADRIARLLLDGVKSAYPPARPRASRPCPP
ncbi:MAG TPA: TetR/AcrR family transcriptional regulator [Chthonomonadaceae bacterium]|nr:TetR/AcrR family transcriptional regulator [Chthonomonadaceae bacterium]